jgi:hypothetical protein
MDIKLDGDCETWQSWTIPLLATIHNMLLPSPYSNVFARSDDISYDWMSAFGTTTLRGYFHKLGAENPAVFDTS